MDSGILHERLTTPPPQPLLDIVGHGEFFPHSALLDWLSKYLCTADMIAEDLCEDIMFLLCGFDKNNTNIVS